MIYFLNSAVFFLVRKFYMLRCLFGLYMLIWGASVFLGSFLSIKSPTQTNGEVWKTTKNTSITECFAATSTFTQYRFGKFFKAQLWENVHNVINSTERSDILVFNCYLCHVRFLLTCYVCSTKIGEISDISKFFENFVSQTLGVLTRIYAAELRVLLVNPKKVKQIRIDVVIEKRNTNERSRTKNAIIKWKR